MVCSSLDQSPVNEPYEGLVHADKGVGHDPGLNVVGAVAVSSAREGGERCRVRSENLPLASLEVGASGDHARMPARYLALSWSWAARRPRGRSAETTEGGEDGLAYGPGPHSVQQFGFEGLHALEDEVLLGREVVEDCGFRHLGSPGYLGYGDRCETALDEQSPGRVGDQLAGPVLFAFSQAKFSLDFLKLPQTS